MSKALRQQGAQEKSLSGCVVTVVFPERVSPPTIFECHA